jgi:hypothetical protein
LVQLQWVNKTGDEASTKGMFIYSRYDWRWNRRSSHLASQKRPSENVHLSELCYR